MGKPGGSGSGEDLGLRSRGLQCRTCRSRVLSHSIPCVAPGFLICKETTKAPHTPLLRGGQVSEGLGQLWSEYRVRFIYFACKETSAV